MFPNIDQTAVAAILHGQQCAKRLKTLFENRETSSSLAEPLINTIRDSFSLALASMDYPNPPSHHQSSSQNIASCLVPQRSSKKKIYGVEGLENYRDDSPTPLSDDGFTWRKYGRKNIKASPHQRSYYQCTYAKKQNCDATKRVQQIKDNPPVYRTIYLGQHVCNRTAAPSFVVNDYTYTPEMMQADQSVMPQLESIDHQKVTMGDEAIDRIMNQKCDINDLFMDDDQLWENVFFHGHRES